MIVQKIYPKQDCPHCHGNGEVFDIVPYGSTTAMMPSLCECVEAQADEDVDDIELVFRNTQIIDGHEITLEEGRYLATRPMATHHLNQSLFPVHIKNEKGVTVLTIPDLSYDEANDFLNEFNNGTTSYEGRAWE